MLPGRPAAIRIAAGLSLLVLTGILSPPFACAAAPMPPEASESATAHTPVALARLTSLQAEATFMLNHDQRKAEQGFLKATELAPTYAPAWFDLGVLAEGRKAWATAQGHFRRYLALQPTGADADRARAQLILVDQYAKGATTPESARSMQYDGRIQRARAFLAGGYFRESIAEAGQAQGLDPERWEAYAVVSLAMAKQNKPQEAAKFQARALDHAPPDKRLAIRAALTSPKS
jgi:Tfp pilus assembly protein PilF